MTLGLLPRIEAQISPEPNSGCWLWTGAVDYKGYGKVSFGQKNRLAHRIVYELLVGSIPKNLELDHLCRVTGCCNPQHLEPVTRKINVYRGIGPTKQNAIQTHCIRGHEASFINTRITKEGWRYCRVCQRLRRKNA